MRASSILALALVAVAGAACGGPVVTDLDPAATPEETATPAATPAATSTPAAEPLPSFATYQSQIIPIEIAQNCRSCHASGAGGFVFDPSDSNASTQQGTYLPHHFCNDGDRTRAFSPPDSKLLSYFCNSRTSAKSGQHEGRSLSGSDCTAIYDFLAEGGATTPPPCSQYP